MCGRLGDKPFGRQTDYLADRRGGDNRVRLRLGLGLAGLGLELVMELVGSWLGLWLGSVETVAQTSVDQMVCRPNPTVTMWTT